MVINTEGNKKNSSAFIKVFNSGTATLHYFPGKGHEDLRIMGYTCILTVLYKQ